MSKKDIYLPNIDWSKVSGDILSHTSDALIEAKQLVHQISTYRHWNSDMPILQQYQEKVRRLIEMTSNLFGVHWIKVWGSVLLRAYKLRDDILSSASQLWGIIPSGAFRLWRIMIWGPSKLCGAIIWGSSKILGAVPSNTYELRDTSRILLSTSDSTAFSCVSHALTGVNVWSIRHPYIAAAVLLWISEHPGIVLAPLQTGKPTPHTRTSTVPLNHGYYDTAVTNEYENMNARKAESTAVLSVSWLTGLGAVFVLGRRWGWWD